MGLPLLRRDYGFRIKASRSVLTVPVSVKNVRVSDTNLSGNVRIDFDKLPNILMYEYRYRKTNRKWECWSDRIMTSSFRGNIIAGLEVAQV